ncbi:type IX secretion system membrane protein PorP/SprF [Sungkyunkwania multivorans]|uniref:Type IX secretion system membrane protein PorP/SprF n=1 Tax=Sungkyunkwania multivorans TaxID=1173618 RepID=A0ABW3D103_9FLAO
MKYKYCHLVIFLFVSSFLKAQEGIPVYLDYLSDNYYLVFPSMAGAGYGGKARLTARQQWFDQQEAPNLQTVNAHARVGQQSGIGGIVFRDQNGYHSQTGVQLTYAHHLNFWRGNDKEVNQLSFGLSLGVIQASLDETNFDPRDFDPLIAGIKQSTSYFNVDFGFSYHLLNLYAHFAVKNLLFANRNINSEIESNNQRNYLLAGGYVFEGKRGWSYEPSLLFQWYEFTGQGSIDINGKVYKDLEQATIWGGLSYRNSFDGAQFVDGVGVGEQRLQLISPIIGFNKNNWMFAYTYSYQIGDITFDSGGFHQITLGFNFLESQKPYDCKCPSVNY